MHATCAQVETALKFIQENDVQELAPDLAAMIKTLFISGKQPGPQQGLSERAGRARQYKGVTRASTNSIRSVLVHAAGICGRPSSFYTKPFPDIPVSLFRRSYAWCQLRQPEHKKSVSGNHQYAGDGSPAVTAVMKSTTSNR